MRKRVIEHDHDIGFDPPEQLEDAGCSVDVLGDQGPIGHEQLQRLLVGVPDPRPEVSVVVGGEDADVVPVVLDQSLADRVRHAGEARV